MSSHSSHRGTDLCIVILVYDHLLTFDSEVEHFWSTPFTLGNALFFANRYFTLCVIAITWATRTVTVTSVSLAVTRAVFVLIYVFRNVRGSWPSASFLWLQLRPLSWVLELPPFSVMFANKKIL
jgi:hypothetical protein